MGGHHAGPARALGEASPLADAVFAHPTLAETPVAIRNIKAVAPFATVSHTVGPSEMPRERA